MAKHEERLTWRQVGKRENSYFVAQLGDDEALSAIFTLQPDEHRPEQWLLKTTLPGYHMVGAMGTSGATREGMEQYAEDALADFYKRMKKVMEPKSRTRRMP